MRIAILSLIAASAGCGASSAEIKQARDASYKAEYQRVWQSVLSSVESEYEIASQDEKTGVIRTAWKKVERTAEGASDTRTSMQGALLFRAKILVRGGPPWVAYVDGIAGELKPGMTAITTIKHGAADEPPWVEARIDNLYVSIHERLKEAAQYDGVTPPLPAEAAVDDAMSVELGTNPGMGAPATPGPAN